MTAAKEIVRVEAGNLSDLTLIVSERISQIIKQERLRLAICTCHNFELCFNQQLISLLSLSFLSTYYMSN